MSAPVSGACPASLPTVDPLYAAPLGVGRLEEMAFQAHPDIPLGGIPAGPRKGPMYAMLEREAKEAGLRLHWPARLPNTRQALAAAE